MSGIDLAYDLVPSSYDWAIQRLNSMENRIQALMVFTASFMLTGPALVAVAVDTISFTSWWFYLALAVAFVNLLVGAVFRMLGALELPGPRAEGEWPNLEETDFKWATIYWANEHFKRNTRLINLKWKGGVFMTVAFIVETTLLAVWGILQVAQ